MYKDYYNQNDIKKYPLLIDAINIASKNVEGAINGHLLNESKLIYEVNYNKKHNNIYFYFYKKHWFQIMILKSTDINYSSDYGIIQNNYFDLYIVHYYNSQYSISMHHTLPITLDEFLDFYTKIILNIPIKVLKDIYLKLEPIICLHQFF